MASGAIMGVLIKLKTMKNYGIGGGIWMTTKRWKDTILMVQKLEFGHGGMIQEIKNKRGTI